VFFLDPDLPEQRGLSEALEQEASNFDLPAEEGSSVVRIVKYWREYRKREQSFLEAKARFVQEHLMERRRIDERIIWDGAGSNANAALTVFRHFDSATVAKGLAVPEMCHTYNLRNKQEYIETLRQTNKKLSETKKALKESEEQAMREKDAAQDASDTMNSMLNKLPNGVVIVDNELKILQSNARFLEIIGEDAKAIAEIIPGLRGADLKTLLPFNVYNIFSFVLRENESVISRDVQLEDRMFNISIFPIRQNRIAGAVIRDLFSPEVQREEVITRVSDVIDKNLEMVQKIGFLLGEGASETEKMLNSIVESFRQKKNAAGK
jgi:PAS domain-containing protein